MEQDPREFANEYQKAINRRLAATTKQLMRYPIMLYSFDGKLYQPKGSGVFFHYKQFSFILTAAHVIDDYQPLFTNLGSGIVPVREFRNLRGISNLKENKTVDIGWITLTVNFSRELATFRAFLTIEDLIDHDPNDYRLEIPLYVFAGFPAAMNMKVGSRDAKIRFDVGAIHVGPVKNRDAVFKHLHLEATANIAFGLLGKAPEIMRNIPKFKLPELNGMSGSPIWWLFYNAKENEPEFSSKVIGIFSDYRNGKYHCAIGTKIFIVVENIDVWIEKGYFDLSHEDQHRFWSENIDNKLKS